MGAGGRGVWDLEGGEGDAHDFADVLAEDGLPQGRADGGVGVADAHGLEDGLPCKDPGDGAAECLHGVPCLMCERRSGRFCQA